MPHQEPHQGDVYQVYRAVTTNPAAVGNLTRPMACVDRKRLDPSTWTAMARSSTDGRPWEGDVSSPVNDALGLDRAGHWSLRWLHQVSKHKTGGQACEWKGCLPEPEKSEVLNYYRNRRN